MIPETKVKARGFWWGWAAYAACLGLLEDVMGKEHYLRWARNNWISGWWTVPLEVVVLIAAIGWKVRNS